MPEADVVKAKKTVAEEKAKVEKIVEDSILDETDEDYDTDLETLKQDIAGIR